MTNQEAHIQAQVLFGRDVYISYNTNASVEMDEIFCIWRHHTSGANNELGSGASWEDAIEDAKQYARDTTDHASNVIKISDYLKA